jgi:hypothetical protein
MALNPPASITPGAATTSLLEKEWPVRLYRQLSSPNGLSWQRMSAKTATSGGKRAVVKVAPRKDCIVLRRLQIRVRLVHHCCDTNKKDNVADEPPLRMQVTRRRNRILISSNQRLRILLLQFKTETDCLAFADQLVALNPPPTVPQRLEAFSQNYQQQQDVFSYVFRLLHDPEFAGFCRRLESSLGSTPDGMRALQALTMSDETSNND